MMGVEASLALHNVAKRGILDVEQAGNLATGRVTSMHASCADDAARNVLSAADVVVSQER